MMDPIYRQSAWEPTPQKGKRPLLRFEPILSLSAEDSLLSTNFAASLTSCSVDSVVSRTMPLNATAVVSQGSGADETPFNSLSQHMSTSENIFAGNIIQSLRNKCAQINLKMLTEAELSHVKLVHKQYVDSIGQPGCLLTFLRGLPVGDSHVDCEWLLQHLEVFLSLSRDQLAGCSFSEDVGCETSLDKLHVITEREAVYFFTYLKTMHGNNAPRQPAGYSTPVAYDVESTPKVVSKEGNSNIDFDDRNCSDAEKGTRDCKDLTTEAKQNSASRKETESLTPRTLRKLTSEAIVTSARGYLLELKTFAELGGGEDGSGAIRLLDLKRMLQAFHFDANFDACVGRVIDPMRTGMITFNEFLWILEFGVRGDGPAAAMHEFLASPINSSPISSLATSRKPCRSLVPASRRQQQRKHSGVGLPMLKAAAAAAARTTATANEARQRVAGRSVCRRRRTAGNVKQCLFASTFCMSPYAFPCHSARGKQNPQSQRGGKSSVRSRPKSTRCCSSRVSSGERSTVKKTADPRSKRPKSQQGNNLDEELDLLRSEQMRITKKLHALIALPVDAHNAHRRQEKLQHAQGALNNVLDCIAAKLRDIARTRAAEGK